MEERVWNDEKWASRQKLFREKVRIIERRIGQHEIGLQVFVQVTTERLGVLGAEVSFDAANGQVHHRQPPRRGVGLSPGDRNVAERPLGVFEPGEDAERAGLERAELAAMTNPATPPPRPLG